MNHRKSKSFSTIHYVLILCFAFLGGCATPFPTSRGITITRPLAPESPGFFTTLQIKWLGTASFAIQLGYEVVLTDPFFTRQSLLKVGFGEVVPDPAKSREALKRLPVPRAIFVGHSHYDHMLDLAPTLRLLYGHEVQVYGSETTRNILSGFSRDLADRSWRPVSTEAAWHDVGDGIQYQAVPAQHAPNLKLFGRDVVLYSGKVAEPLTQEPRKAADFKVGETYAYTFRFSNEHLDLSENEHRSYSVHFAGAATTAPRGFPNESIATVDVVILCVPGWKNVTDYPGPLLERLRPRVVILSHFDDMFQERGVIRNTVVSAALDDFLEVVKRHINYPEFEQIVVPDVGETLLIRKP